MKPLILLFVATAVLISCKKEMDPTDPVIPDTPILGIDSVSLHFSNTINAVDSFIVNFNGKWSIEAEPATISWIELSATSGTNTARIIVKLLQPNFTSEIRKATFTIMAEAEGIEPVSLDIIQEPYSFSPWSRLYGGTSEESFNAVVSTPDGGFLAVGQSNSNNGDIENAHGSIDVWVVKVDPAGNIVWEKTYGGSSYDLAHHVAAVEGGYIIHASTSSIDGNVTNPNDLNTTWLIKIDESGQIVWEKTLQDVEGGSMPGFTKLSSGGFICSGSFQKDGIIIKFNDTGTELWRKTLGGINFDRISSVAELANGSLVATGNTDNNIINTPPTLDSVNVWALKLTSDGNVLWSKQFGGSKMDIGEQVIATSDGGALINANTVSSEISGYHADYDIMLIKIDGNGNLQWQQAYGSSGPDNSKQVLEYSNGNFLLVAEGYNGGDFDSGNGESDAWLLWLNDSGHIVSREMSGGANNDGIKRVLIVDNKKLQVGYSQSNTGDFAGNHGGSDAWISVSHLD